MSKGTAPLTTIIGREPGRVRLVQITDCHLYREADGKLLGLKTLESFHAVRDAVKAEHDVPDLALVTGDISQDGTAESYQRLCAGVTELSYPQYWIPGQHDDLPVMAEHLHGANIHADKRLLAGARWQIVMLNSGVPHRVYGKFLQDQLDLLAQALHDYPDRHLLVVLHHHPVKVHCFWLDTIGLNNPDAMMALLKKHKKQVVVLWGHIHQAFDSVQDGMRLLATPSTCVQFKPFSQDFQADTENPGYRLLNLNDDGSVDSNVVRVDSVEFTIDYSVKGY